MGLKFGRGGQKRCLKCHERFDDFVMKVNICIKIDNIVYIDI